jgi:hypothetical protein
VVECGKAEVGRAVDERIEAFVAGSLRKIIDQRVRIAE